jgi:hypothetical protein
VAVTAATAVTAVIAAAVLATATTAHADDDKPEYQHMRIAERGDSLTISTEPPGGIGKLFDTTAYDRLSAGDVSTVVIRIQITPIDSDTPVAQNVITREVTYDVWDDVYFVRIDQPGGRKTIKVKYRAEVLKELTAIDNVPIAKLAVFPVGQQFVLKMVAELNPVSKETLAEIRRWLSQGNGGGLDRGGAFFGSFVSVFYNPKIADAARVLRLRSQPFYRLPP